MDVQIRDVGFEDVSHLFGELTPEQRVALVANPDKLQNLAMLLAAQAKENKFFKALEICEATALLQTVMPRAGDVGRLVCDCQDIADKVGTLKGDPIFWRVRAGVQFLPDIMELGPVEKRLNYGYLDINDEPTTRDQLVFWVPCVIPWSLGKTVQEQIGLLEDLRRESKGPLPVGFLDSFGTATVLSGLILTYYRLSGEKVLEPYYLEARTNTVFKSWVFTRRIVIDSFGQDGLSFDTCLSDKRANDDVGCFAYGAVNL